MRKQLKRETLYFWGIIALTLGLRLFFYHQFGNIFSHEGESYSKINLARGWVYGGMPYPDPNFGPLHTWLIYALYWLFGDWVTPLRLFGVIVGTFSVAFFYGALREELGTKEALFGGLLYAAFPMHLRASPTGIAETPYIFFLTMGLYAFLRLRNREQDQWFNTIVAAVGFTGAGMLRYEAWLFLPVLCLLLLLKRKIVATFVFGALCSLFPLVHMYETYKLTGDPTNFSKVAATIAHQYMPWVYSDFERLTGWSVNIFYGVGAPVAALLLIGLIYSLYKRQGWIFAAILAAPFAVVHYKSYTNTMDPSLERYSLSFATLLLPYAALLLARMHDWLCSHRPEFVHVLTAAVLIIAGYQVNLGYAQAQKNQFPIDIQNVVKWLRNNSSDKDRVLADKQFHPYVVIESGLEHENFVSIEWEAGTDKIQENALERMLTEKTPTIVILDYTFANIPHVNSNLDAFPIPKDENRATFHGLEFVKEFQEGNYAVFRVVKPPASRP